MPFSQICCICMSEYQLLNLHTLDLDNSTFLDKLKFCIPEIVYELDVLPKLICRCCCIDLKKAQMFKESYLKTLEILKKYIEDEKALEVESLVSDESTDEMMEDAAKDDIEKIPDIGTEEVVKAATDDPFEGLTIDGIDSFKSEWDDDKKVQNESIDEDILMELSHSDVTEYWKNWNISYVHKNRNLKKCTLSKRTDSSPFLVKVFKNTNGLQMYSCKVCKQNFTSIYSLNAHVEMHIEDKNLYCAVCKRQFKIFKSYITHISKHNKCPVCPKYFKDESEVLKHIRKENDNKTYVCRDCGNNFQQNSDSYKEILLQDITDTCGDQVNIKCPQCVKLSLREYVYKCEKCFQVFEKAESLIGHKAIHDVIDPLS